MRGRGKQIGRSIGSELVAEKVHIQVRAGQTYIKGVLHFSKGAKEKERGERERGEKNLHFK